MDGMGIFFQNTSVFFMFVHGLLLFVLGQMSHPQFPLEPRKICRKSWRWGWIFGWRKNMRFRWEKWPKERDENEDGLMMMMMIMIMIMMMVEAVVGLQEMRAERIRKK